MTREGGVAAVHTLASHCNDVSSMSEGRRSSAAAAGAGVSKSGPHHALRHDEVAAATDSCWKGVPADCHPRQTGLGALSDKFEYLVKEKDTLTSIAASFDVTPSLLKKLNKMAMDFVYPGQTVLIPERHGHGPAQPCGSTALSAEMENVAHHKVWNGHTLHNHVDQERSVSGKPRSPVPVVIVLSDSDAAALDQQCLEMFIKVSAKHITDSHGLLPGTLLATPSGIMFDPEIRDDDLSKCVASACPVYAAMESVCSATLYRDVTMISGCDTLSAHHIADGAPVPIIGVCQATSFHESALSTGAQLQAQQQTERDVIAPGGADRAAVSSHQLTSERESLGSHTAAATCLGVDSKVVQVLSDSALCTDSKLSAPVSVLTTSTLAAEGAVKTARPDTATRLPAAENTSHSPPITNGRATTISVDDSHDAKTQLHVISSSNASEMNMDQGPFSSPFYLCLRVSVPVDATHQHYNEAYHQRKKPEHWFALAAADKVDSLYTFFLKWKPDTGSCHREFDLIPSFASATSDTPEWQAVAEETFNVGIAKKPVKLTCLLQKKWEITSTAEVKAVTTLLEVEKNLPLPEADSPSAFLTEMQRRELAGALPYRVEGNEWQLVFSTELHGFSLSQLYWRMRNVDSPVLLVLQDTCGVVFGALTSCRLAVSDHFYGTGESFLFTFADRFKVYPWTGENNLFIRGSLDNLWIGTGEGTFGLYLDGDLCQGRTQHCKTYSNEPLTGGAEDFVIKHLEAWCFHC